MNKFNINNREYISGALANKIEISLRFLTPSNKFNITTGLLFPACLHNTSLLDIV